MEHRSARMQVSQRGRDARQTSRPCATKVTCRDERKSVGIRVSRSRPRGSFHGPRCARPSRWASRQMWVSTGRTSRFSVYSMTQSAVLRATPGSVVRYCSTSSSGVGRSRSRLRQPSRASISANIPQIWVALVGARPASWRSVSSWEDGAARTADHVGRERRRRRYVRRCFVSCVILESTRKIKSSRGSEGLKWRGRPYATRSRRSMSRGGRSSTESTPRILGSVMRIAPWSPIRPWTRLS